MKVVSIERSVDMRKGNNIVLISKDILFDFSFSKLSEDLKLSDSRAVFVKKDKLGVENSSNSVFLHSDLTSEKPIGHDDLIKTSLRMRPDVVFVEEFAVNEDKMISRDSEFAFTTGHSLGVIFKGRDISRVIDDLKESGLNKVNSNNNVFLYSHGRKWAVDLDS